MANMSRRAMIKAICAAMLTAGLPASPPPFTANRSRLGPELVGAGLNCGLTVVAAVGVFGGAAAEVPSGGTSTFLVVMAWTVMGTSPNPVMKIIGRSVR